MAQPQITPDAEMVDALSTLPVWVLTALLNYTTWDVDPLHRVQGLYHLISVTLAEKAGQKQEQEA